MILLLLFTLGYICQNIGNVILIQNIRRKKNTEGLSFETQIAYLIGAIARILWVNHTNLSRYWFVWLELFVSLGISIWMVTLFVKYKNNSFTQISNPFKLPFLFIGCAVLSFFFHLGNRVSGKWFTAQMLLSFTMFLEASGLLPQIYILRKIKAVEVTVSNYLFLLAVSRAIRMVFWVVSWLDNKAYGFLMVADLAHTILLADFVYYYLKTKRGTPILLH